MSTDVVIHLEDRQLARLVAQHDRKAADRFARRLLPWARRCVWGLGLRGPDSDDVAQIVLLELLKSAKGYSGKGTLENWAYRIAVRTSLKWIRRAKKLEEPLVTQIDELDRIENNDMFVSHDGSALTEQMPRPLRHYLERLPELQREALLMRFALGHSAHEIAELSETPLPTVKSRLQKARREIQRWIRQDLAVASSRGGPSNQPQTGQSQPNVTNSEVSQ